MSTNSGITSTSKSSEEQINSLKQRVFQLEEITQRHERSKNIQSALFEIANLSSTADNLTTFFRDLHLIINELMYANNFYIALLDNSKMNVSFAYFEDTRDPNDPSKEPPVPRILFEKSITGYLFKTGEALLADYKKLEALEREQKIELKGPPSIGWLGIPLKNANDVIGAMVVQSYIPDITYKESDKELLIFVAQHITAALLRKLAYDDLEKRVKIRTNELEQSNRILENEIVERKQAEYIQSALLKITDITNTSENLEQFYKSIHQIIGQLMNANNFFIAVYDETTDSLEMVYFIDDIDSKPPPGKLSKIRKNATPSLTQQVFMSGNGLLLQADYLTKLHTKPGPLGSTASSWLGVPLKLEDEVIGVLVVQSYTSDIIYSEQDQTILTYVSQHVATALNRKYQQDSLLEAHNKLRRINDELEQRVEERTDEFAKANSALQRTLKERRIIEKKLAYDAFHDSLTGLPNRALFIDRLEVRLATNQREVNNIFSVIYMDLDRFKIINDSLGHLAGDTLLREASARISACIRPQDTLARLGGDEFCILLESISSEDDVILVAERVLETFFEPFHILEQEIYAGASLGITLSTVGYSNTEEMLRDADVAMYRSKEGGKSCYTIFDKSMRKRVVHRLKIENELRHAVEKQQIEAHFQPIVDLVSNKIVSFEALARWKHPELGNISPDIFIPIAEETGVIKEIGEYMLTIATGQIKAWQSAYFDKKNLSVSVNVSPHQIQHQNIAIDIDTILQRTGLAPNSLKLEITEGLLIHNFDTAKRLFLDLEERGINVMLDDFGTGYSSLSYLHNFKFKVLKIDRSFVNLINNGTQHLSIIQTIVTLANLLKISVVAEGIETKEQLKTLANIGVQYGQGYYIGKPMSAKDAENYLQNSE